MQKRWDKDSFYLIGPIAVQISLLLSSLMHIWTEISHLPSVMLEMHDCGNNKFSWPLSAFEKPFLLLESRAILVFPEIHIYKEFILESYRKQNSHPVGVLYPIFVFWIGELGLPTPGLAGSRAGSWTDLLPFKEHFDGIGTFPCDPCFAV